VRRPSIPASAYGTKENKEYERILFCDDLSRKIILPKEYETGDHHLPKKPKKKRRF
jgi:hypothetical protein